jgi:3',5'-cyclic AMP phosphodiesterase CpdA
MVDVKTETAPLGKVVDPEQTRSTDPDSFSLAHLSDLHLTSLNNIKIFPQLLNKRLLGYLSWRHKRRVVHRREIIEALLDDLHITNPEQIVVTGDLTHLGLPMEYAEVAQWLPSLGTPEQVTVIPGNHEAYSGKSWFKSCDGWAPYLESDTQLDLPKTADFFPSLRIRGQVAIIGLCSARPSLPLLAIGSLGQKQLSGLEVLLQETGDRGLLRIVLVHHPPVPGTVNWRKRLTDVKALTTVLARHGAELVLHGHAHTPALSVLETPSGAIPVIGAPSASELSPWTGNCAKYNIYRMRRLGASWELTMSVRGYSEETGRFAPEEETVLSLPRPEVAESRED